jgi:hypothetical protein
MMTSIVREKLKFIKSQDGRAQFEENVKIKKRGFRARLKLKTTLV